MKKVNLEVDRKLGHLKFILMTLIIVVMSACGGGGGGGDDGGIIGTGVVKGTAATGDAIASTVVDLKSNTGETSSDTTDANGKFEIGLLEAGSFLLRVDQGNNNFLYSVAHGDGKNVVTRNIHPFTDLIIRNWFQTKGLDIDSEFTGSGAPSQMPTQAEIDAIEDEINAIVAQVLADYGISTDVDLLATPFDADGTGFDAFILNSPVIINNNQITVIVNDIDLNIEGIVINGVDLGIDFTSGVDAPPTTPQNVRALAASSSEIIVVWEAATDDKGVAGYNVYRNGSFVATTPYPVYSDTGLSTGTNYSYEIEAIDGRGQLSAKSVATMPIMLDTPDTTAPPAPTNLQATATENDISLSWDQTQINDVFGFRILRASAGNVTTEIANITSTIYTDFNLITGTEFCYQVIAYDAAGNESAASNESCATIGGVNPGPSSVSFSAASYTVSENTPSIIITVNRSGDISGAISVGYATTNETAVAGEDYAAASGTLNWAANDSTAKTFTVQIVSDGATEGDETVSLALSNPSTNTSIGTNATAVLTITDVPPVACGSVLSDGNIIADTTLDQPCYEVPNGITVNDPATLTVLPGVRLEFGAGTQLLVRQGAALKAIGNAASLITFTGAQATPGYWDGIDFAFSNSIDNVLDFVTVEYGGVLDDANVVMSGTSGLDQRLKISNTTLRNSQGYGFKFNNTGAIIDTFQNITSTGNAQGAGLIASDFVGKLDAGSDYSGNIQDRVAVAINSGITTNQIWPALNAPYELGIGSGSTLNVEAHVTISPGSTLIFNAGNWVNVKDNGSLTAVGTAAEPILFTGKSHTPGFWKGIQFTWSNNIDNQLDHVTVEDGGATGNGNANVVMFGTFGLPQRLKISNTILRNSSGYGFEFDDGAIIDEFSNVVSTGNELAAGLVPGYLLGKLDSASQYTGNVEDVIRVTGSDIDTVTTWPKLDVPYDILNRFSVDAALTIEQGTTMFFNSGAGFRVTVEHTDICGQLN